MDIEQPDERNLDVRLDPVEYPADIQTVSELLERAIALAGRDPKDVLHRTEAWTDRP